MFFYTYKNIKDTLFSLSTMMRWIEVKAHTILCFPSLNKHNKGDACENKHQSWNNWDAGCAYRSSHSTLTCVYSDCTITNPLLIHCLPFRNFKAKSQLQPRTWGSWRSASGSRRSGQGGGLSGYVLRANQPFCYIDTNVYIHTHQVKGRKRALYYSMNSSVHWKTRVDLLCSYFCHAAAAVCPTTFKFNLADTQVKQLKRLRRCFS